MLLPVSAPFHSSLMRPAADRLAQRLASVAIASPTIPVLHNVDVAERSDPEAIRAALALQAASAVRWVETIRAFAARGVTHVVECGPGRVLSGLNKRIVRDLKSFALTDGSDMDATRSALAG
jgi:[acyl-carrier-protein] S-malonyltransferase